MKHLPPIARKFILHWGEMGVRWGINRTMAQIHALLFLSEKPLDAEEICRALDLARSNVSVALKELQGWGIVKLVHLPGDRRDHFETHEGRVRNVPDHRAGAQAARDRPHAPPDQRLPGGAREGRGPATPTCASGSRRCRSFSNWRSTSRRNSSGPAPRRSSEPPGWATKPSASSGWAPDDYFLTIYFVIYRNNRYE